VRADRGERGRWCHIMTAVAAAATRTTTELYKIYKSLDNETARREALLWMD